MLLTHVYSEYSLLSSTNRIEALVYHAKQRGYQSLTLTDKGVMYGAIPFYQACTKAGIKPIIGLEVQIETSDVGEPAKLRLLAKNHNGYLNLLHISTMVQMKAEKERELQSTELLPLLDDCVVILSYDAGSIQQLLREGREQAAIEWCQRWIQIQQKDDWYIDLSGDRDHDLTHWRMICRFAAERGLKVTGSTPVWFTNKEDYEAYATVRAIRLGETIQLADLGDKERSYYLKPKDEYSLLFTDFKEVLHGLEEIDKKCRVELDLDKRYLPSYPFTKEQDTKKALRAACFEGVGKRFGNQKTDQIMQRLEHELSIIHQMGFDDYFLIVSDFMKYARGRQMMTGPGRGSAAGSLVAYVLYITDVDPLKYGLLFERFLNPERVSLPDIDIDFPDHRRDEVIEYVQQKYGQDRVAQIATFGTLAAKAAIRDTGKALAVDAFLVEKVAKLIPSAPNMTLKKALEQEAELRQLMEGEAKRLVTIAQAIEGLPRHVSTHAAGVVISPRPLTDLVALQKGQGQVVLTQATMGVVEDVGLVKFDFLGLRNLTLLERVVAIIKNQTGKKINVLELPLQDELTYRLLTAGDTTGVFQLESSGMRQALRSLKPTEFEDIVAVNALYRPGPMEFIDQYVAGKHGEKKINLLHADLEEIIGSTYGVIVYQEQIMKIAVKMAGFTLAEADSLRRAISKKNKQELDRSRERFITGAKQKSYEEKVSQQIFNLIERFANYGFNRSHAVAYSMISYQLAYLKAHYPLAFFTALLSSVWNTPLKLKELLVEMKRSEIEILPPTLSKSQLLFSLEKDAVRFGLLPISHVGVQAAKHIVELSSKKPFADLFDYCVRVDQRLVNKRATENLIKSGALDEFGEDRATLLYSLDLAYEFAEKVQTFQNESEGLFTIDVKSPDYERVEPLTVQEKLIFEKEAIGLYLSGHPIEQVSEVLEKFDRTPIVEISDMKSMHPRIAGLVSAVKKITTKKGDPMAFMEMGDETGQCEVTVFPREWKQYTKVLKEGALLFMEGKVDESRGRLQFVLEKCVTVESITNPPKRVPALYLKVEDQDQFESIKELLHDDQGQTNVIVYLQSHKKTIQLQESFRVGPSNTCMQELISKLGKDRVVLK
ncbi:DNA polymerase III subunit alpha [Bacillus sp. FJAT-45037]|uniref:DNA polymerase III subunit alpha n=1 Tax=Bacillus sp. FJAT-45037 TaxID=2011007 RepID=UPI000C23ECDE|nr:DNA polymerase III subunit alpha [Bacillus sp. FJAT-45037]